MRNFWHSSISNLKPSFDLSNCIDFHILSSPILFLDKTWVWIQKTENFVGRCIVRTTSQLVLIILNLKYMMKLPPAKSWIHPYIFSVITITITQPIFKVRVILTRIFPAITYTFKKGLAQKVNYTEIFFVGLVEEIAFRGVIQQVILTNISKYIVRKISPEKEHLVNSRMMKGVRVVLTAGLFALAHGNGYGHLKGSLSPQFICGIIAGSFYESGVSIKEIAMYHFAYDAVLVSLMGGY